MLVQTRKLRFETLANSGSFILKDNWRFLGVLAEGDGVTITNGEAEVLTLSDGEAYNQWLPSESFASVTVATDGASTCKISYFF